MLKSSSTNAADFGRLRMARDGLCDDGVTRRGIQPRQIFKLHDHARTLLQQGFMAQ
jgi:hypothetical protein